MVVMVGVWNLVGYGWGMEFGGVWLGYGIWWGVVGDDGNVFFKE